MLPHYLMSQNHKCRGDRISSPGSARAEARSAQPCHLPLLRGADTHASAFNMVDFCNTLLCISTHNTGTRKGTNRRGFCRGESVAGSAQAGQSAWAARHPNRRLRGQPVLSRYFLGLLTQPQESFPGTIHGHLGHIVKGLLRGGFTLAGSSAELPAGHSHASSQNCADVQPAHTCGVGELGELPKH